MAFGHLGSQFDSTATHCPRFAISTSRGQRQRQIEVCRGKVVF
jgi:hypothetical protein